MTTPERSKRLGELFSQAWSLGEAELARFVDEKCADDPALREELENLLALRNKTTKQLRSSGLDDETLDSEALGGLPTPIAQAIAECAERPTRIRQYKILDLLGEGGMGSVYLAEQNEPVRRRVALKVIKAGMYTKEIVARLEAERQALAIMNHASIARFYDAGTTEEGHPYFAMEHVKGLPITDYCDHHRLGIQERLELFVQVCQGVEHAHRRGVIHRDIKPGNILVSTSGEGAVAKIIDFGVAKATTRKLTEKTLYTQPGRAVGTPAYMSPEQADMTTEEVDHRSDIYALGVLLYELLVGQLPLELDDDAISFSEVIRRIREDEPATPSRRWRRLAVAEAERLAHRRRTTRARLRSELRGGLDWITVKALEKEPIRRYASASDLAEDIRRHMSHQAVFAGPPSSAYRLRKFMRKRRGPVVAVACVVVAFAVGQLVNLIEYGTARANFNLAEARLRETRATLGNASFQDYLHRVQEALASLDRGNILEAQRLLEECPEEFRKSWEWRHLKLRTDLSWRVLRGHEEAENPQPSRNKVVATFTPDGESIVSGGWDRTVRIWSMETRELVKTLSGHEAGVNAVAVSRDGSFIASASSDKTIALWDAKTGSLFVLLEGHEDQVSSVAFDRQGEHVASGSWDQTVRLWKVPGESGRPDPPRVLRGHEGEVGSVAFSPDGRFLASGSHDGTVRLWDVATGDEKRVFEQNGGAVWSVAFSPNGTRIASGSDDGTVRLWDVATGAHTALHAQGAVFAVAFNTDGTRLASGSRNNIVQLWDARTGEALATLPGHRHDVWSVAFSPDDRLIASGSRDRTVRLWDSQTRRAVTALRGHQGRISSLAMSRQGRCIASGSGDRTVRAWDATTGDLIATFRDHEDEVLSVSVSPGGGIIASASADGTVRLWDLATRSALLPPLQHGSAVRAVAFSPDGKRVASGATDRIIRVWDVATGRLLHALEGHRGEPSSLAYSRDGGLLATASAGWVDADLVIRLWDTDTRQLVRALGGHTRDVNCITFSPDEVLLASGSDDRTVRLWDVASGEPLVSLQGHEAPVTAVAFSPDGTRLVSGARDHTLRVWDVASGTTVVTLRVEATVNSLVFDRRGMRLVTGSEDNMVTIWESEYSSAREMWHAAAKR